VFAKITARKEASGLRLLVQMLHTQEVTGSSPLPPILASVPAENNLIILNPPPKSLFFSLQFLSRLSLKVSLPVEGLDSN
jgi:hypothetical protein